MSVISIVIPTRNRHQHLARCLNSLLRHSLNSSDFEVIVIDNGSTDDTRQIVDGFQSKLVNLRYAYEASPGLYVGRHRGYQEAQGDILVYADDDIEAFATWLEAIQDAFRDPKVVMVGGKCLPMFESGPPDWLTAMWRPNPAGERILGYLSLIDLGDEVKPVNPFYVFGCNFAIRRSVLREAGGFHPDGMPQELIHFRGDGESYVSSFIQAKGYHALYHPAAAVYHAVPRSRMTSAYFCRRAFNQGISDSFTAIRRAQGLDAVPVEDRADPPPAPAPGQAPSFYRRLRAKPLSEFPGAVIRRAQRLLGWDQPRPAPVHPAADPHAALHLAIQAAHDRGYAYHQDCVARSPALLGWVIRDDYWDCPLPDVPGCTGGTVVDPFSAAPLGMHHA